MTTVSVNKQFSSHDCSLGDTLSDLDRLYGELTEDGQSTGIIRGSGCAYSLDLPLFPFFSVLQLQKSWDKVPHDAGIIASA